MKKTSIIIALLIVAVSITGCKSNQEKAEQTADKFLKAFYVNMDFDKCKGLSTPTSIEVIADRQVVVSHNPYSKEEHPDVKIVNTIIAGEDNARTIYQINGARRNLFLVKNSKNKWLVDAQESELSEDPGPGLGKGSGFAVATSVSRKGKNADKK
jgi:prolyl-tRNA synthetase